MELIRNILHIAKPMLIVANKADLPTAEENIKKNAGKISLCYTCICRI